MPLKLKKAQGSAQTNVQEKHKGQVISDKSTEEKVDVPPPEHPPQDKPWCEVGVEASYTMNMGNYNSTRLSVSLKIPCLHEEIDTVFEYGKDWVDSKMQSMIGEIEGQG